MTNGKRDGRRLINMSALGSGVQEATDGRRGGRSSSGSGLGSRAPQFKPMREEVGVA
jgi:hypothetical protein